MDKLGRLQSRSGRGGEEQSNSFTALYQELHPGRPARSLVPIL